MKAAGLKPIATLLETSAVLIKSKHPSHPELIDRICSRIRGVISAAPPFSQFHMTLSLTHLLL